MEDGGDEHWLVQMEWLPAGWSVCLPVNLPLHHKVQKFSSGTGHPDGPRKRTVKRLCVLFCMAFLHLWHVVVFAVTYRDGGQQISSVQLLHKHQDQKSRVRIVDHYYM